jgi:hypothetical protein
VIVERQDPHAEIRVRAIEAVRALKLELALIGHMPGQVERGFRTLRPFVSRRALLERCGGDAVVYGYAIVLVSEFAVLK